MQIMYVHCIGPIRLLDTNALNPFLSEGTIKIFLHNTAGATIDRGVYSRRRSNTVRTKVVPALT